MKISFSKIIITLLLFSINELALAGDNAANTAILIQSSGSPAIAPPPTTPPPSLKLQCEENDYHVSSGNHQGNCQHNVSTSDVSCNDSQGNSAAASCQHGCIQSTGSGQCNYYKH